LLLRRTDITSALHAAVTDDADLRFGTTITAIVNDGKPKVMLSDGSQLEADLLIGADGVHSQMRPMLFGSDAQYLEPLGYQFAAYDSLNLPGLKDCSAFYLAPRHFAEYYPMGDALAALQVWPSTMTTAVPAEE